MIRLEPGAHVPGRAFTEVARSRADAAVMTTMLGRLRAHVAAVDESPRFDRFTDPDGSQHKIVLPGHLGIQRPGDLFGVGFFGQARTGVDHAPIIDLEAALIDDMPGTRGLVAYYNTFHAATGWGNLVLFEDEDAKSAWGGDRRHADAVARSPAHYHSIRLHHARVVGGLTGTGGLELIRTRYLDYEGEATWRAIRRYGSA